MGSNSAAASENHRVDIVCQPCHTSQLPMLLQRCAAAVVAPYQPGFAAAAVVATLKRQDGEVHERHRGLKDDEGAVCGQG